MAYSNRSDLLVDLLKAVDRLQRAGAAPVSERRSVRCERVPRVWRVRDRLSEADVRELVSAYLSGVTARELADRFAIGLSSVKRLLREHGARRTATA
ncbi:hypothetical protein [Herbihabitans rhizosphaerae]|uniref:hypothetical protein n=1 Tax=Herbihabitans rhizosphaerae TaxID=1872711 RepID=UPI00102B53A4|nr:hypothetical protein [Herbihabitans rhizosphaerae]